MPDPVPVRWACSNLCVCFSLQLQVGGAAYCHGPLLCLRGPQQDCMPCVLRICVCAWAPPGCVRWVAVADVVVVTGPALPSFSSLGGCRTRRCWNRCWRYTVRGNERVFEPSARFVPPLDCAVLRGRGAVGPRHAALAVAVGARVVRHPSAVSCASPVVHLPRSLSVWEWGVVAAALCRRPFPVVVSPPPSL
jgi:hypothetical protein